MFNTFALTILERLHGKKLAAIFGEVPGTTERTWRNRLTGGWHPSPEELEALREQTRAYLATQLTTKGGWPEEEAEEILSRCPSWTAGVGLPTANLIFWTSPRYGDGYEEAMSVAGQFDQLSYAVSDAFKSHEITAVRQALLDAAKWLRGFCPSEVDTSDFDELVSRIKSGTELDSLKACGDQLAEQLIYHVLSCWDVLFCSHYFSGKLSPFPLFELVMPRLAPDIEIEPGTLRFLRHGEQPKQKIFEKSVSRLFDFLAVLIHWKKCRQPPERVPPVKTMAAWFRESERRIVNWRDETTRFTYKQLCDIWQSATEPDKEGNYPGTPGPMLVAAHLWSPLLVREDGKLKKWFVCFDAYEVWWKRNLDRLTAKGLPFGEIPWPICLTYQSEGNRSPELWRSSQSSGLSSQPLDSQ